jgi:Tol biopolymer transport system component
MNPPEDIEKHLRVWAEECIWRSLQEEHRDERLKQLSACHEECKRQGRPELYQKVTWSVMRKILTELRKVQRSAQFKDSKVLKRILTFIVKQSIRDEPLKETTLGVEARRKPNYDPRTGNLRSDVHRLRGSLQKYYLAFGQNDSVVIEVPTGAYRAVFRHGPASAPEPAPADTVIVTTVSGGLQTKTELQADEVAILWKRILRWGAGMTIAGLLCVYLLLFSHGRSVPVRIAPLNGLPGSAVFPAFAHTAQEIAFTWNKDNENTYRLYVQLIGAGAPLAITRGIGTEISPVWSPNDTHVAFLRIDGEHAGIFEVPALGGGERLLTAVYPNRSEVLGRQLDWSPDGQILAIVDKNSPKEPFVIYLFDINARKRKRLTSPAAGTVGDSDPAFSPDARRIAFVRTTDVGIKDIHMVDVESGSEQQLTFDGRYVYGVSWAHGGAELLFSSNRSGTPGLWKISADVQPGFFRGLFQPERLAGAGERALYPAFHSRGTWLAYTTFSVNTNIWEVDLTAPKGDAHLRKLIYTKRHCAGPQFSPDGTKIVFASDRSGSFEIWICDRDGNNARQLTGFRSPTGAGTPRWSPDGSQIAFDSRVEGNANIYVVNSEGGVPTRLTRDHSENVVPSWSCDGKWIYFSSNRRGSQQVWRIPVIGGEPMQVTKDGGFAAFESPDRQFLYYSKGRNEPGLWKIPLASGEETPVIASFRRGFWGMWAVVNNGIYYVDFIGPNGTPPAALRFLDLNTKTTSQIAILDRLRYVHYQGLAISPDHRRFLFPELDQTDGEIMLAEYSH